MAVDRWYISDHHLWHENILQYGKRPFSNLKEMHEALLERHNSVVKSNDHVSFLGDVTLWRGGRLQRESFQKVIKQYQGHKRLYLGNHDHFPIQVYKDVFEKIYATWRSDEGIIFSHFPLHPSTLISATANVHGHIHQNASPPPAEIRGKEYYDRTIPAKKVPYINVSVEAVNYTPVHLDELLARIKTVNGK